MSDDTYRPGIPGYMTIKEAADMLSLSPSRVYEYVEDGRLPSVRAAHVIVIPIEEVKKFKRNIAGRPRKSMPIWRISPADNTLLMTLIFVQVREGKWEALMQRLEEIKQERAYVFPGTVARYVSNSETVP